MQQHTHAGSSSKGVAVVQVVSRELVPTNVCDVAEKVREERSSFRVSCAEPVQNIRCVWLALWLGDQVHTIVLRYKANLRACYHRARTLSQLGSRLGACVKGDLRLRRRSSTDNCTPVRIVRATPVRRPLGSGGVHGSGGISRTHVMGGPAHKQLERDLSNRRARDACAFGNDNAWRRHASRRWELGRPLDTVGAQEVQ